jgi:hypothetical protein
MPRKNPSADIIPLAEARIRRVLDGVGRHLGGEAEALALSEGIARQLAAMPSDQRRLLRRQVALSTHDLEELVNSLEAELGLLADDLRAVNLRSEAARAYRRAAIMAPHRHRP